MCRIWLKIYRIPGNVPKSMEPGEGHMRYYCLLFVEIIKLYLVQTGRFSAATGYVAPTPNLVQHNLHDHSVSQRIMSPWKNTIVCIALIVLLVPC